MNITLEPLVPLPTALQRVPQSVSGRRHRIGDHEIEPDALRHFNDLLEYLDLQQPALDRDQLASAARDLVDHTRLGDAPRCIAQRMHRAAAVDMMAADYDWDVRDAAAIRAETVLVDYLRGDTVLIPRAMPVVGRLDDAIVVDAAWPWLAREVAQYLAFRRVRHLEASLRGETRQHFGFTREDWQAAAHAEQEWIAHCARVGQHSYLRGDAGLGFRVH